MESKLSHLKWNGYLEKAFDHLQVLKIRKSAKSVALEFLRIFAATEGGFMFKDTLNFPFISIVLNRANKTGGVKQGYLYPMISKMPKNGELIVSSENIVQIKKKYLYKLEISDVEHQALLFLMDAPTYDYAFYTENETYNNFYLCVKLPIDNATFGLIFMFAMVKPAYTYDPWCVKENMGATVV